MLLPAIASFFFWLLCAKYFIKGFFFRYFVYFVLYFCWKCGEILPKPADAKLVAQRPNWSASKTCQYAYNKTQRHSTKSPPVATPVPSEIQCHPWGIDIPWYTFRSRDPTFSAHPVTTDNEEAEWASSLSTVNSAYVHYLRWLYRTNVKRLGI